MFNRCGYPKERFLSGTLSPPANCDHSLIFANLNIAMSKPKCYKQILIGMKKFFICQMLIKPTITGLSSFEKLSTLIYQTGSLLSDLEISPG